LQALGLPTGARTLASTPVSFDPAGPATGWLVVTTRGLGIGQAPDKIRLSHTDWNGIEWITLKRLPDCPKRGSAAWLKIHLVDQSPTRQIVLPNAGKRVASVIHERFEASIVTVEYLPVAGGTLRGALRRDHNQDLEVQVTVPDELDAQAPEVKAAVQYLAQRLGEAAGLRTW